MSLWCEKFPFRHIAEKNRAVQCNAPADLPREKSPLTLKRSASIFPVAVGMKYTGTALLLVVCG